MPSQRRVRLYALLFALTVLVLFYMSRGAPLTHASDFTTKTQDALQSQEYAEAARQRDADSVGSRLKAAEAAAKKAADDKSTDFKVAVQGDADKSVAGRVKLGAHDDKKVPGVAAHGGRPHDAPIAEGETNEEHDVEIELNAILKKSPTIIFSKSYCPFSKKAKHILLDRYHITPTPYVVELDLHPLGPLLQRTLGQMTGRATVPNVLLMGKSIGGGDEMQQLDEDGGLVEKFRTLGGSRISEVVKVAR